MSREDVIKSFGRVAVLMGGTSSEREVSLNSGANVLESLQKSGVNVFAVDGIDELVGLIHASKVDRVFNILHGCRGGGEDGVLQGLLEAMGVPYTGSGVLGSSLSMDKIRSKQVWLSLGLSTPRYAQISRPEQIFSAVSTLGYPLFIKPSCEGSSVGVSRVFSESDLDDAIALASKYPGELLMEQFIQVDGAGAGEFTVAILGDRALPSIRIVPAAEYYDYHAKYISDETQYICPGLVGDNEVAIQRLALDAFRALDCRGWGRVDIMRDRDGRLWLLEVNTAPGMTSHSLVPKAAAAAGISFDQLCLDILSESLHGGSP